MIRTETACAVIAGIVIAFCASPRIHAQEKNEPENLYVLADDLKFKNGVQFMKLNMPEKALETLNEYLEIYQNGIHRQEAYRHIAELYAARMEYLKAIDRYRSLYEEFSTTEAGVEAYFNIGLCYQKMGYEKEAAGVFNDLIQNHGDSPFAQQARTLLDMQSILNEE